MDNQCSLPYRFNLKLPNYFNFFNWLKKELLQNTENVSVALEDI